MVSSTQLYSTPSPFHSLHSSPRTFGQGDNALRYLDIDLSVPFDKKTALAGGRLRAFETFQVALGVNVIPIALHLVGFPVYLLYVLYRYRLNLQRKRASLSARESISAKLQGHYEVYGFLVAGYRDGVEWWEFTILLRRL